MQAANTTPQAEVEACVQAWFQPRGATTFRDLCSESDAGGALSLAEALDLFGDEYASMHEIAPECADLRSAF